MNTRTFFKSIALLALSPLAVFAAKPKSHHIKPVSTSERVSQHRWTDVGGYHISGYRWNVRLPDGRSLDDAQSLALYKEVSAVLDKHLLS